MEEKKYNVEGTVTISTQEYRDLIVEGLNAKHDYEQANSERWRLSSKVNELEKELDSVRKELSDYKKYVSDTGEKDKFELWIIRRTDD